MSARAGFEFLEHTADVGIRSFGASVEEVFEQATRGLAEIIGAWRWDPDAEIEAGTRSRWRSTPTPVTLPACWWTG